MVIFICSNIYLGKLIYSLRHKFLFSVFVYFFILIFLSLGTWQLIRLNWKIELISEINNSLDNDAVSFDGKYPKNYKRVKFDVDINDTQVIFLYSLNENGEPGFDVINSIKIDNFNIDGDFIESQAFAFLAIRSILKLPISDVFLT